MTKRNPAILAAERMLALDDKQAAAEAEAVDRVEKRFDEKREKLLQELSAEDREKALKALSLLRGDEG